MQFLAWRNLKQSRARTLFSALGVSLGVGMVVAADVISQSIRRAGGQTGYGAQAISQMLGIGLNLVGLVILVAAGFVVLNAFAMSVTQRRRTIGLLRSVGLTRGQVVRLVLAEALFTGGLGTLLGLVGGPLLGLFTFYQGDWTSALPVMEAGCGLLLTPRVARLNRAWLGDTINLPGRDGPVPCTVAGLGTSTFFGNTIVSVQAGEALGVDLDLPFVLMIQAQADPAANPAARERFKSELQGLIAPYPKVSLLDPTTDFDIDVLLGTFQTMLNGPLLLAILAAALGVINTMLMSVTERRRELGSLRALGATRQQVGAVVLGEAALIGLVGGGLGLLSGTGLVIIMVMVMGGNGWGVRDLPLWSSAWASIQPGLLNGLAGLIVAPLICAGAAWLPLRPLMRLSVITSLRQTHSQIG